MLDVNASFDFGKGGCLFSAHGAELDHIVRQGRSHVWTLTESDGHHEISDGLHYINRLGYFVTESPCPIGTFVTVRLV